MPTVLADAQSTATTAPTPLTEMPRIGVIGDLVTAALDVLTLCYRSPNEEGKTLAQVHYEAVAPSVFTVRASLDSLKGIERVRLIIGSHGPDNFHSTELASHMFLAESEGVHLSIDVPVEADSVTVKIDSAVFDDSDTGQACFNIEEGT